MSLRLSILVLFSTLAVHAQTFAPRYELVKLKEVNSIYHDAAPVVSPDGKTLYFFVADHPQNTFGKTGTQDVWVSKRDDKGNWQPAQHLGAPFNQNKTNQVFQVLKDGSMLVRGGRSRDELGFSIVTSGGAWQELEIQDFKSMAKGRFNGAVISSDRRHLILYFSEQPNSARSDLYISHEQGGKWSKPEKLKLSTAYDDYAPFLSPDNTTLYFSSDRMGQGRQGGADIYKSQRLDDSWTSWGDPTNLGKPVNTAAADSYFSMDEQGNVFTARANSRVDGGTLDIFILIPKDIKIMLTGTVFDEKTKQPINGAHVNVTIQDVKPVDLKTPASGKFETRIPETKQYVISADASGYQPKQLTMDLPVLGGDTTLVTELFLQPIAKKLIVKGKVFNKKTNEPLVGSKVQLMLWPTKTAPAAMETQQGAFESEVQALGWYHLVGTAEGFLSSTDSVWFNAEEMSPVSKDLYLTPIEVGLTVRLKNIYFDFNKTTLKPESFVELNKVVDFLNQNASVEIEIAGHTDNKGTDDYNATLSQGRSQAVVDYLIRQGIASSRLTAHGYGESKPIDTNDTDEGRANNRRVEFTILKK